LKKIGIVLSAAPAYSETFMTSKIKGLLANGFDVTLFIDDPKSKTELCKCVHAHKLPSNKALRMLRIFSLYASTKLKAGKVLTNFEKLEQQDGISGQTKWKRFYLAAHILPFQLDQLHFGFSTTTVGRENVAAAIGAKMSTSFRGFDINVFPKTKPSIYNRMWKQVNKVHSISNSLVIEAYKYGLQKETPVSLITPAIDVQMFQSNNEERFTDEPVQMLTVARLHWIKDLMTAIKAMSIVREQKSDFVFNIIGEGEEREKLTYLIHQLGLSKHVFLLGKKTTQEIAEMLKSTAIYLQTSLQEGFCNAALEAQSTGCLTIVSDASGLQENVENEVSGFVVPRSNAVALANKIIEVTALPLEKKLQFSKQARKRIEEHFTIEQQQKKFVEFFS
jgi:colanic acid/amylovoran biosynthesis glycosyltransferase